jgi:hypothetical protein
MCRPRNPPTGDRHTLRCQIRLCQVSSLRLSASIGATGTRGRLEHVTANHERP